MWLTMLAAVALAEDPLPAPAPAPIVEPAPADAPPPAVASVPVVKPPDWWVGGCDVSVVVPDGGKLADPATADCSWKGKGKFLEPKDEAHPATACEAWFKSVAGMITGKVVVDAVCPKGHQAAIKNFVLDNEWNAPAVHLVVRFSD